MSLRRRLALLEWARQAGILIFEDDYDSEYRYSGRPIPAMQGLDRSGVVIFAGSFSAVLFPALRLGYLVVPPEMVDVFAAAESVSTHHPPLLEQAVFATSSPKDTSRAISAACANSMPNGCPCCSNAPRRSWRVRWRFPAWRLGCKRSAGCRRGLKAERVADLAAARDVEGVPLSRYASGRSRREGLILGFAAVDPKELRRGCGGIGKDTGVGGIAVELRWSGRTRGANYASICRSSVGPTQPAVGGRLFCCWEARRSITKTWRQKLGSAVSFLFVPRSSYLSTNFANIFFGSIAINKPLLRARTSPF